MPSIERWNFIFWSNHIIICRLYSRSQEYHRCVFKIEEETIIHHRYFRRSILNFSETASPLYKIFTNTQSKQRHSKEPIDSNDNHQIALEKLLYHLVTPPALAYPGYDHPFILYTDASRVRLDCSSLQMQNGKLIVLGFGNHALVDAAKKLSACKHFLDYLFYLPSFAVYADYNPLTYIKSSCKVIATGQGWINELTEFNFMLHYKPDVENVVADTLSRLPINNL